MSATIYQLQTRERSVSPDVQRLQDLKRVEIVAERWDARIDHSATWSEAFAVFSDIEYSFSIVAAKRKKAAARCNLLGGGVTE